MREAIAAAIGTSGAFIISSLGGWDTSLQTLVSFMAINYISGLAVAGIFKRSKNSVNGALSSDYCWRGLAKKGMKLLFVLIGYRLDLMIGADFVRTAIIIAFISHELISIIENAGMMGIPIPAKLYKAIDILNGKELI